MLSVEGLVAQARTAFGWTDDVTVSPGPRGALGQIWRIETGIARYALKHLVDEPPSDTSLRAEADLADRARAAGVHVPACHPDRAGRQLCTASDGTWFRCYDWVDLQPITISTPGVAARVGALIAALHRCAPPMAFEPYDGSPPDPWYHSTPAFSDWAELVRARRFEALLPTLPQLAAVARPLPPERLILCHRDLHPENVFTDETGALVVVDWDDLGPADPGQELARAVVDWCCTRGVSDLDAARAMVMSYREAGGPGRITEIADFSMLVACRLNFVLAHARLALEPGADPQRRAWADEEIEMMLAIMPTAAQLDEVLAVTCRASDPHTSPPSPSR